MSSTDLMTHYEFAKLYTKVFSHTDSLIIKGKWNFPLLNYIEMSLLEEMRFEMDLSNMESFLNIKLPSIQESLNFTMQRFKLSQSESSKKSKKGGAITYI